MQQFLSISTIEGHPWGIPAVGWNRDLRWTKQEDGVNCRVVAIVLSPDDSRSARNNVNFSFPIYLLCSFTSLCLFLCLRTLSWSIARERKRILKGRLRMPCKPEQIRQNDCCRENDLHSHKPKFPREGTNHSHCILEKFRRLLHGTRRRNGLGMRAMSIGTRFPSTEHWHGPVAVDERTFTDCAKPRRRANSH